MTVAMASRYDQLLDEITARPEDDDARLRLAEHVRSYDAAWAKLIELQIARARKRRTERRTIPPSQEELALLREHGAQWTHTLAKYARRCEHYRGLVEEIAIDPHVFLEYGEWLAKNAPIRHVVFLRPDGPFPVAELAASPLLGRLDSIGLPRLGLTDHDVATFVASPHLKRLAYLDLSGNPIGLPAYEALAASAKTRGLLVVRRDETDPEHYDPGQQSRPSNRDDQFGAAIWEWTPPSPEGQALEQRYGYLPWLYPEHNGTDRFDARWFLDHKVLPVKPAGSR
jgi:hypothetical protein